jgi:hypothetical protein
VLNKLTTEMVNQNELRLYSYRLEGWIKCQVPSLTNTDVSLICDNSSCYV